MTEPDVALTDFALCAECAIFVWALRRTRAHPVAAAAMAMFTALSLASLLGGITHGFARNESTLSFAILWRATLCCMGGVAAGLAATAFALLGLRINAALAGLWAVYALVALAVTQKFWLAIVAYLPAVILLLSVFLYQRMRHGKKFATYGALAMMLTCVASALQQLHVGLHPVYLTHNALYHLIEAIALATLFVAVLCASKGHAS